MVSGYMMIKQAIGSKRVDPVSGARVFNLLKGFISSGLDNEKT